MNLFGLLPKCLDKIFNGVSHFACNSRKYFFENSGLGRQARLLSAVIVACLMRQSCNVKAIRKHNPFL